VARVRLPEREWCAGLRQARDELLYLHPFIDMAMRHEFHLRPPAEKPPARIVEQGGVSVAGFASARRPVACPDPLADARRAFTGVEAAMADAAGDPR
jgi:hypothetical protein